MPTPDEILAATGTVVLVDWPSRAVPDGLARAGLHVFVKRGPGPADFSVSEVDGETVVGRPVGIPPAHADLIYAHRPLAELPGIVQLAQRLGATAIWYQSGLDASGARDAAGCWLPADDETLARARVEDAGLTWVCAESILTVLGRIGAGTGDRS